MARSLIIVLLLGVAANAGAATLTRSLTSAEQAYAAQILKKTIEGFPSCVKPASACTFNGRSWTPAEITDENLDAFVARRGELERDRIVADMQMISVKCGSASFDVLVAMSASDRRRAPLFVSASASSPPRAMARPQALSVRTYTPERIDRAALLALLHTLQSISPPAATSALPPFKKAAFSRATEEVQVDDTALKVEAREAFVLAPRSDGTDIDARLLDLLKNDSTLDPSLATDFLAQKPEDLTKVLPERLWREHGANPALPEVALSRVGFSRDGRQALVRVALSQGHSRSANFYLLGKSTDTWEVTHVIHQGDIVPR